jgi:PKD repeat protein
LSYYWVFGDSGISSTIKNPTHAYTKAGIYSVGLTVSDKKVAVFKSISVKVGTIDSSVIPPANLPPVISSMTVTPLKPAVGQIVQFNCVASDPNSDILSYYWIFGDSSVSSAIKNPTHVYTKAGTYTVGLLVSDKKITVSKYLTIIVGTSVTAIPVDSTSWVKTGSTYSATIKDSNNTIVMSSTSKLTGTAIITQTPIDTAVIGNKTGVTAVTVNLSSGISTYMDSAKLSIGYSNMDVSKLNQKSMKIYYKNEISGRWDSVGGVVDTVKKTVTACVKHFSTYGIFGVNNGTEILPVTGAISAKTGMFTASTMVKGNVNFSFTLGSESNVQMNIYDIQGSLVKNLVSGKYAQGVYNVTWNGASNVSSGLYIARLNVGQQNFIQKINLLR